MKTLFRNALVVTQNSSRECSRLDVVVENGAITEVSKEAKGSNYDETIDCKDKLLMPGLVNTHTHAAMSLLRGYGDDLRLQEWLEKRIWPAESKLTPSDIYSGSLLSFIEMLRGGTTCFNDMYFQISEIAKAAEKISIRGLIGYGMIDLGDSSKREKELKECKNSIASIKASSPGGLIKASVCPHAPYTCSEELLRESARIARENSLKLHIHLSETRKELADSLKQKKKRPAEYLDSIGFLGPNVIAAHGVWLSKRECELLGKKGVSIAHCPASNMKLASGGVAPLPELFDAKVKVGIGTDGAASNNSHSMFSEMKLACLAQKNQRWDGTVMPAQQALDCATINGSKMLGFNGGSIEKGKDADIVLLDLNSPNLRPLHNAVSQIVYAADPSNVTDVMVGGKFVVREKKLCVKGINEEEIGKQVQKIAEKF
ncbi:5'-deoxyadenosine deaminase [Candidatus Gugararchaeum adminiculabundum]|nr:5'-deoxyadenosine deaminase [Candidatus Gugararchaeum adminiculabundum]